MIQCVICNEEIKPFEALDACCYKDDAGELKRFHNRCFAKREREKIERANVWINPAVEVINDR